MKEIPLSQGFFAVVDDEDHDELQKYTWHVTSGRADGQRYAIRCIGGPVKVKMHRQILRAQPGQDVDHINHNGLDNRRSNIRLCSRTQNGWNRRPNKKSSSPYKGVSRKGSTERWAARITVFQKQLHLGYFATETLAGICYDEAARRYFGDFACTNFPQSKAPGHKSGGQGAAK